MRLLLLFGLVWTYNEHNHHNEHVPYKHDYKLSFKKPYVFPNGSTDIPYFHTSNGVLKSKDLIRLTSSIPDQRGFIYSSSPMNYPEWEVEFSFNANGRGYAGGKGLAFWYVQNKLEEGHMFGVNEHNKGIGIFFDTSDAAENRFTPIIYAARNDGYQNFAGRKDYKEFSLGSCFRDYRNAPNPVWARAIYTHRRLKVEVDIRQDGYAYTECFTIENLDLPTGYYIGLSASTDIHGGDDHDIDSFETYQLNPPAKTNPDRPSEQQHKKHHDEFKFDDSMKHKIDEMEKKLKEAESKSSGSAGGFQEAVTPHVIQQLEANQFHIIEALNLIHQKLDMQPIPHQGGHGQLPEVSHLQADLQALTRDVRELANIVHEALGKMINQDTREGSQLHQYVESHFANIHYKLDHQNQALNTMHDKVGSSHHYSTYFVFFLLGIIVIYYWIRIRNAETKKYF